MISRMKLSWLAVVLVSFGLLAGCSSQPEVSSREAMDLIKQFYTAANSKSEKRLADSEAEMKELIEAKKLSEAEIKAFEEIRDLARSGDWEKAQNRALSFAEAQVR